MKRVLVSRCLLECCYRYDAKDVRVENIKELLKNYEVIPICPEVELLGLPVPRPRLKLVPVKGEIRLLKEDTGEDLTEVLEKKSREFLEKVKPIHAAFLKSKSPSCGVKDAKVYKCLNCEEEVGRESGIFAKVLMEMFPDIPIITF
ncbi:DUF523 domain-containing protein [Aquifex aeolicus]|uniref:Uncharacterized protein n=1 Tax=Aquifex aeolicus (strain VF5) TaxID=224324 RepID=O67106_AQUAE|nr:DUF523 domain-containing protein [Aquifex aeolicus]AAC07068.1 putative protein [Aquifex aeolicus VF5]